MGRSSHVLEAHATFNPAAWEPTERAYGLLQLLVCRGHMTEELSKPKVDDHLKSMDSRQFAKYMEQVSLKTCPGSPGFTGSCPGSPGSASCSTGTPPRDHVPELSLDDLDDSDLSEGDLRPNEKVDIEGTWGRGKKGSWWRVRDSLQAPISVRVGVSLDSAEIRRIAPGEVLQQAGAPRSLGGSSKGAGSIRMPIRPSGWVTADATRANGQQYLVRAGVPRWRVISDIEVLVRADETMTSEKTGRLIKGDIVEQDGPIVHTANGIIRMPIISSAIRPVTDPDAEGDQRYQAHSKGMSAKGTGWVSVDAKSAGGPTFFDMMPDAERVIQTQRRSAKQRARNNGGTFE